MNKKDLLPIYNENHNNKYDYSLVPNIIKNKDKIKIICPEHGIFEQRVDSHKISGCPTCSNKKFTTSKFIDKAKTIFPYYDYSLVDYINAKIKVKIICPEHGEFEKIPDDMLYSKQGCPYCNNKKTSNNMFIEKSKILFGENKYDYSLVNFVNNNSKIKLICPEHGEFETLPNNHLSGKDGCPKCNGRYITTDDFIKKAKEIHIDKYDYSLVKYINNHTKVKIICPKHGIFEQKPSDHNLGCGCPNCQIYILDDFIKDAIKKHNNKYDYSLVDYINSQTKVKIICPKHGTFEQTPNNHKLGCGCPYCNESKGENKISKILDENNIDYNRQHKFDDCKNKKRLPFDFYLSKLNMCIEYDGKQHFEPISYWGGDAAFEKIKINDNIKNIYCKNNDIKLLRISYKENEDISNILLKILNT